MEEVELETWNDGGAHGERGKRVWTEMAVGLESVEEESGVDREHGEIENHGKRIEMERRESVERDMERWWCAWRAWKEGLDGEMVSMECVPRVFSQESSRMGGRTSEVVGSREKAYVVECGVQRRLLGVCV